MEPPDQAGGDPCKLDHSWNLSVALQWSRLTRQAETAEAGLGPRLLRGFNGAA